LDYVNDEYLDLYLEKNKISRLKKIVKNYFLKISEIKIDFQAIYNFYKNKNLEFESESQNQNQKENKNNYEEEKNKEENLFFENQKENKNQKEDEEIKIVQIEDIGVEQTIDKESLENENLKSEKIEIFQIGEENSLRMVIFDEKITELEKVELRLSDIGEISEFDFGDMIVFTDTEEEIKMIFSGSELFETPNFVENESFFDAKSLKEIKILDVATVLFLFLGYFLLSNFVVIPATTGLLYLAIVLLVSTPIHGLQLLVYHLMLQIAQGMTVGVRGIVQLPGAQLPTIYTTLSQTILLYVALLALVGAWYKLQAKREDAALLA